MYVVVIISLFNDIGYVYVRLDRVYAGVLLDVDAACRRLACIQTCRLPGMDGHTIDVQARAKLGRATDAHRLEGAPHGAAVAAPRAIEIPQACTVSLRASK